MATAAPCQAGGFIPGFAAAAAGRFAQLCERIVPHCNWKKQPETPAELERAIGVLEAQELGCHRYAGTDPAILDRLTSTDCDYPRQIPSVVQPIDPQPPRFALLDRPGPFTRTWRIITGRKAE